MCLYVHYDGYSLCEEIYPPTHMYTYTLYVYRKSARKQSQDVTVNSVVKLPPSKNYMHIYIWLPGS